MSVPTLTRVISKSSVKAAPGEQEPKGAMTVDSKSALIQPGQIFDLPVLALAEHSAWTPTGLWHGQFDCAVWLRTPQGLAQPVQLFLRYVDNQGEKNIFIDRCSAGSFRTVLLNGSTSLSVNGRVRSLEFQLVGAMAMTVMIEEWHLVPQQRQMR